MTEWLALVVALLAVIVGPSVQYAIARKQITATLVSASRKEWINVLRDHVAEFMMIAFAVYAVRKGGPEMGEEELGRRIERIYFIGASTSVMIDMDNPLHRRFQTAMDHLKVIAVSPADEVSDTDFHTAYDGFGSLAMHMVKAERELIQQGK